MNAITTTAPPLAYGDLERLAESIAKSGLFGIKTKDQAIALMMIAHAEGRHPALAARDYDIIQGRPAKKAEAMMRDFLEAGGKIEWHSVTDELADATFTHPQTGSVRIDWDMKRAVVAFGKKDMYAKFPRQMLRSRVVSEGVRTLWPLATSGFHVPEEMGDMKPTAEVEHNGPTIEAEPPHGIKLPSEATQERMKPAVKPPPSHRDAINAEIPLKPDAESDRGARAPSPAAQMTALKQHAEKPGHDPLAGDLGWEWMQALTLALRAAKSQDEVTRIGGHKRVSDALTDPATPDKVKREITAMLADAFGKFVDDGSSAAEPIPDDDEVRIVGEEKLAAG